MSRWGFAPYVPVAQRKAKAKKEMEKLRKKGMDICPVDIEGRTIAKSFWGKGWCEHLESFSDYSNRLPRGRTYARNGSVCHLDIEPGTIEAMVSGTKIYKVRISIKKLNVKKWKLIKSKCFGQIGSMLELLQGKFSKEVMTIVSHQQNGLFPLPDEISLSCSCPDWAVMCKHVAATLYGVGNRLDNEPELLFNLRGVDASELINDNLTIPDPASQAAQNTLHEDSLGDIFGIDLDDAPLPPETGKKQNKSTKKKAGQPASTGKQQAAGKTVKQAKPKKSAANKKVSKKFKPTGANIKQLRLACELSVPKFAAQVGVSPASIYRWEKTSGECSILDSSLKQLEKMHNSLK